MSLLSANALPVVGRRVAPLRSLSAHRGARGERIGMGGLLREAARWWREQPDAAGPTIQAGATDLRSFAGRANMESVALNTDHFRRRRWNHGR
jgi:hypothetical protein